MYLFLCLIPFVIWLSITLYLQKKKVSLDKYHNTDYTFVIVVNCVFIGIIFIAILISNMVVFSQQKSDYLTLSRYQESRIILQKKADVLTEKFSSILIDQYPKYEKGIYDKLTSDKLKQLYVSFPEIKASLTLIDYANKIQSLNNDIYDVDIETRKVVQDVRFTFINPWVINSLTPEIPSNLKSIINN